MGHPCPVQIADVPVRALARVRTGAIEANCALLRSKLSGDTALCAVVKADGYGHGMVPCAGAALAGGASCLAVATAAEAVELRAAGFEVPILVQGALTRIEARAAVEAGADVVAWREGFVRAVAADAGAAAVPARVHVKLDTGMGRLGTADPVEARAICDLVAGDARLELVGLMTHFATADERGDDHFPAQLERFRAFVDEITAVHPRVIAHAANSAAVFRDPAAHFDLARCGIAVYGLDPFGEDPAARGLEPALALESHLAALKRFEPGWSAGYGRTWRAERPTWVGIVPLGYGDGWRRGLSNRADVLVGGRRRPLAGTVSMDNVAVELGPDPGDRVGDPVVLIGAQGDQRILCEEVAQRLGTINYEVTCGLLPRIPRLHEAG
ncbi:MAG: alanine racemase [Thermoleophilaceae bacterium]|nr:alanine racemase [Thermoleophilaceae bacterium]